MVWYWLRWACTQGALRWVVRGQAWRGDDFGRLLGSPAGANPYPLVERIRKKGRLVETPLTRVSVDHEMCRNVLRDNRFGRKAARVGPISRRERLIERAPLPPTGLEPPSMLTVDLPEHTRMRRPVAGFFTPRAIENLNERIAAVTTQALDALPVDGPVDVMNSYAIRIPGMIISGMLGMPDDTQSLFVEWADRFTPLLEMGVSWRDFRRSIETMWEMDAVLDRHIAGLRKAPGDDLLSDLIAQSDFDDRELKVTAGLLLGAGLLNAVNLIGNGVVRLLEHPEQVAQLRADPDLWPNAVDEILRFDTPTQFVARSALQDVQLEQVPLHTGELVVLSLAGANRDPEVFDDPNHFDVTRHNAGDHLAFGTGIHACLGGHLARLEGLHALRGLFERFSDLQLAGPPKRSRWLNTRGYQNVPVTLGRPTTVPITS